MLLQRSKVTSPSSQPENTSTITCCLVVRVEMKTINVKTYARILSHRGDFVFPSPRQHSQLNWQWREGKRFVGVSDA